MKAGLLKLEHQRYGYKSKGKCVLLKTCDAYPPFTVYGYQTTMNTHTHVNSFNMALTRSHLFFVLFFDYIESPSIAARTEI